MRVLITGITGSLGKEVTKQLLAQKHQVFGVSRDELKQQQFPHEAHGLYIGDIRDYSRLLDIVQDCNPDMIFHFAALKHVDVLEKHPSESLKTNILGSENVIRVQKQWNIKKVVLSSTDKAVMPINVYGCSKNIAERIVIGASKNNVVCRYGNVLASRGSVVPIFIESLRKSRAVNITDMNMTRFWIKLEDAAKFVIKSALYETGLQIPPIKSASLVEIVECLAELMGIKKVYYNLVGLRPGEKIHEHMMAAHEGEELLSNTGVKFNNSELKNLLQEYL